MFSSVLYSRSPKSPSVWREWIEMFTPSPGKSIAASLPPCGGSGLKCENKCKVETLSSLPPCGGSGLKYKSGDPRAIVASLPPCGGSGLKFSANSIPRIKDKVSLRVEGVD